MLVDAYWLLLLETFSCTYFWDYNFKCRTFDQLPNLIRDRIELLTWNVIHETSLLNVLTLAPMNHMLFIRMSNVIHIKIWHILYHFSHAALSLLCYQQKYSAIYRCKQITTINFSVFSFVIWYNNCFLSHPFKQAIYKRLKCMVINLNWAASDDELSSNE